MSEELTRFPITPQERHQTARSFDDVRAVPEENLPRREDQPQDKPVPADRSEEAGGDQQDTARSSRQTGGDAEATASIEEREAVATDSDDLMDDDRDEQ